MPTLANIHGGSLVTDVGPGLSKLVKAFDKMAERRRKSKRDADLAEKLRKLFGGEPSAPTGASPTAGRPTPTEFGRRAGPPDDRDDRDDRSAPSDSLGILGEINPEFARMAGDLLKTQDPEETRAFRTEASKGVALAKEIQELPTFQDKIRRLSEEAGRVAAAGGDVTRLAELANLDEPHLDLELTKMRVMGDVALKAVPKIVTDPADALRFFSTPERQAAFADIVATDPRLAGDLLSARENQFGREAAATTAATAAEAAERAPKTTLGKTIAAVGADIAAGRIRPEVGERMIANARAEVMKPPKRIARLEDVFDEQENIIGQRNPITNELTGVPKTFGAGVDGADTFAIETEILDDGAVIQATQSGAVIVKNPLGEVVEGEARLDVLQKSKQATASMAGLIAAEKAAGAEAIQKSSAAFDALEIVQENIRNLEDVVRLIDEGAPSGPINAWLPNLSANAVALGNLQKRLGLDVIKSVRFGALSKGERMMALDVALPIGLRPEQLREWLTARINVQRKWAEALSDTARFLGTPGNTIAGYLEKLEKLEKEQAEGRPQAANGATVGEGATEQPPEASGARYEEGATATNPSTGEKFIFRNGRWQTRVTP